MATLNNDQAAAAQRFFDFMDDLTATEFVIQGPAGTGKTTLLRYLLSELPKQEQARSTLGIEIFDRQHTHCVATTRKAAQVISDITQEEPQTIHSLLGLVLRNNTATGEQDLVAGRHSQPIENALIIIDEASFVDQTLLETIRRRTVNCKVLYVGDPYQLLPTAQSRCPIFSGLIPSAHLTEVVRNEGTIEKLSGQYRDAVVSGIFQDIHADNDSVKYVEADEFREIIEDNFLSEDYNPNKVKILAWTNARVHQYNALLRSMMGYGNELTTGEYVICNAPIIGDKGRTAFPTDSALQITRTYPSFVFQDIQCRSVDVVGANQSASRDLYGDKTTYTLSIADNQEDVKKRLRALKRAKKWSEYFTVKDSIKDLRPPYACTVHKSQGSTYETVLIDLEDIGRCNVPSEVARMLYVAISRASKQVIFCGHLPDKYLGVFYEPQQKYVSSACAAVAM